MVTRTAARCCRFRECNTAKLLASQESQRDATPPGSFGETNINGRDDRDLDLANVTPLAKGPLNKEWVRRVLPAKGGSAAARKCSFGILQVVKLKLSIKVDSVWRDLDDGELRDLGRSTTDVRPRLILQKIITINQPRVGLS